MKSKTLYEDGGYKCKVEYEGEFVRIIEEIDGEIENAITLYIEELDELVDFVKGLSKSK